MYRPESMQKFKLATPLPTNASKNNREISRQSQERRGNCKRPNLDLLSRFRQSRNFFKDENIDRINGESTSIKLEICYDKKNNDEA